MKLLTDESQYRKWIFEEFYGSEDIKDILTMGEAEELEDEIIALQPETFPCLAYIAVGKTVYETGCPKFLSSKEVKDWASAILNAELSH